jgi:MarR family transcriptional regulator, temperature-dependent positive regulator of motility
MEKKLDESPTHLIHRVLQRVGNVFEAEQKNADLTPRQITVLLAVASNEGLSQTGIVERTGVDRATLAEVVRRLQTKGLLHRRRTQQDARAYEVKLTDEGRRIIHVAESLLRRVDQRILGALPPKARDRFMSALKTILGALESESPKKPTRG